MKAMGVDPATLTGVAFHGGKLGFVLQTIPVKEWDDRALITEVCRAAKDAGVTDAWVEDVYGGKNFQSVKVIIEIRTFWMSRLTDFDIQVHSLHPMTWKQDMLPKKPGTNMIVAGRNAQKKAAEEVARSILGLDPDDDNQGDAACIWDWGQRQLDIEQN